VCAVGLRPHTTLVVYNTLVGFGWGLGGRRGSGGPRSPRKNDWVMGGLWISHW